MKRTQDNDTKFSCAHRSSTCWFLSLCVQKQVISVFFMVAGSYCDVVLASAAGTCQFWNPKA